MLSRLVVSAFYQGTGCLSVCYAAAPALCSSQADVTYARKYGKQPRITTVLVELTTLVWRRKFNHADGSIVINACRQRGDWDCMVEQFPAFQNCGFHHNFGYLIYSLTRTNVEFCLVFL